MHTTTSNCAPGSKRHTTPRALHHEKVHGVSKHINIKAHQREQESYGGWAHCGVWAVVAVQDLHVEAGYARAQRMVRGVARRALDLRTHSLPVHARDHLKQSSTFSGAQFCGQRLACSAPTRTGQIGTHKNA